MVNMKKLTCYSCLFVAIMMISKYEDQLIVL